MPPRRWRDGAPIQARTEEQSPGRVRVPARQKAPRSFQRCHPSRGGIQEGPRPERRDERDSRPHDESSRRHGCSKRYEEGTRESSKTARLPLLGRLGPWSVLSTQVERDVRKPARTDCGSQVPGAATHRGDQRNRHRLVPASSGAKAPLACEGRTLVGCARASIKRLQKSASNAEAQRSAPPAGNGARGREPGLRRPARVVGGEKASIVRSAAAKSRCRRSPKPGARKGVAGRRSLLDGRHFGSLRQRASSTRARGG